MPQLTFFQTIGSLFYPVLVRRDSSAVNPVLELYRYRGRWQLATADALYSDGGQYRPLLAAFGVLKPQLPAVKRMLVLGTGLGSAVQVLHEMGFHPACTLVELDEKVLQWALELSAPKTRKQLTPVCADAAHYFEQDTTQYDLVIVDVFQGRHVPAFVLSPAFLEACRAHLAPGGHLVLNYMVRPEGQEQKAKTAIEAVFNQVKMLSFYLNRVFIATA